MTQMKGLDMLYKILSYLPKIQLDPHGPMGPLPVHFSKHFKKKNLIDMLESNVFY